MASQGRSLNDSIFETPAPLNGRKRLYTPGSEFRLHKKRRMSMGSVDLSAEMRAAGTAAPVFGCENASVSSVDRLIPLRPKTIVPLTISPRTNRMYRQFGLLDDRRLSYKDNGLSTASPSSLVSGAQGDAYQLLRRSASTLFSGPKSVNRASVVQNLAQNPKFILALDSPGMTRAPFSTPIAWSLQNQIAVACGKDVYYQDLDTKTIEHFFRAGSNRKDLRVDQATCIAWGGKAHETHLACLNDRGAWEVWDAGRPGASAKAVMESPKSTSLPFPERTKSLCWNGHQITYGSNKGSIRFMDVRTQKEELMYARASADLPGCGHSANVTALTWNQDAVYLASGDADGIVHVWDIRTGKALTEQGRHGKMRHQAGIMNLAWCPWKSDLLATGTAYPEGKIRIWNASNMSSPLTEPERTFALNAVVEGLVWSPHCKEILSVHGMAFEPAPPVRRRHTIFGMPTPSGSKPRTGTGSRESAPRPVMPKLVDSGFTNSIVVHDYPSGKRLFTLPNAHRHTITAAALGPDGESLFTASPREQVIKMWKVWSRPQQKQREDPFASCIIR